MVRTGTRLPDFDDDSVTACGFVVDLPLCIEDFSYFTSTKRVLDFLVDFYQRVYKDLPALVQWAGYVGLTAIIFAETGLLVGFFLPGDSLMVTAGLLCSQPGFGLNVWILGALLTVAGIVGDLRVVNGARGRVAIFQLDDGSQSIEAMVNEDLLNANRERLREDELVIVQGKVQIDRFAGGLRLNINQVWDLAGARARFGKYLAVAVNGKTPPVAEVLRTWPARSVTTEVGESQQGLAIRLRLHRPAVEAELDLGDAARFWPSDEALARWKSLAHEGRATVVYE